MSRYARRARPRPHFATLFAVGALLTGCGGNDDSTPLAAAAPLPAPAASAAAPAASAPVVPAAAPTFFDTASVSADSFAQAGYVFDVEATPALKLTLADIGAFGQLYPSQARAVDAAAGTLTYLGAGQGTYVRAGKVYSVNLRKGGTPVEVQVSALTTACALADQFEVAADGSDTWFRVDEAGPDGDCATDADNRSAMVRTTGTAASAPVFLPTGTQMLQRLPNADMSLRWLLANDTAAVPPKLVLYGTDMTRAGDVAGGAGATRALAVIGYDTPTRVAYLQADTALKRLTWTDTGATLSASLYTFASTAYSGLGVADGTAGYFADGGTLLRIVGTAAPTVVMPAASSTATIANLRQTPTQLVFEAPEVNFAAGLMSVAKAGSAVRTLAPVAAGLRRFQWGVKGEQVLYFVGGSVTGDWRTVGADGSADVAIASHVQWVGPVYEPVQGLSDSYLGYAGVFYCDSGPAATSCNGGSVIQYDAATGTRTTLGTVAAAAGSTAFRATTSLVKGHGGGLKVSARSGGVIHQDLYLFMPGVANSLSRVTTNLP